MLAPLQKQTIPAIVIRKTTSVNLPYEVKKIISVEKFPQDKYYLEFIKQVARYYQVPPLNLIKRFRKFIEQKNKNTDVISTEEKKDKRRSLSNDQQHALNKIKPHIKAEQYNVTILHGVTGSGKTEIYKKLIQEALSQGKSVLLLLPEVTLAMQFENIMLQSFDSNIVHGFHSASTAKQKRGMWQNLINEVPCLIIGVHLPVLLPTSNLGLTIIDEEHECGYQEKKHPCLNSKEVALMRASIYKHPVVLGSATPAISSLYNLKRGNWQLVQMPKRFAGAFPQIEVVELENKKKRAHFLVSNQLANAIQNNLNKKEQTIIFLNRRGYSFFVQCKPCKYIFYCNSCSVSLTLHKDNTLRCHYCDFKEAMPEVCPECKISKGFLKKGVGTQQIVAILEKLFPKAKIARADLDTTLKKKEWQQTVEKFYNKEIDILVGTQTITKGYHFPGVTLVGILWADINLHMPVFNATEKTLQQILQVAGRAGRQSESSRVIVQTMTKHPVFEYLNEVDYLDFYKNEIKKRKLTEYPPINRLVEIELKHESERVVESEIYNFYQNLEKNMAQISTRIKILGPVKPVVSKLKNWHKRQIYLKSPNINDLINLFKQVDQAGYQSKIFFTPGPLS